MSTIPEIASGCVVCWPWFCCWSISGHSTFSSYMTEVGNFFWNRGVFKSAAFNLCRTLLRRGGLQDGIETHIQWKAALHESFKCSWGITQAKWHHSKMPQACACRECSFLLISCIELNLLLLRSRLEYHLLPAKVSSVSSIRGSGYLVASISVVYTKLYLPSILQTNTTYWLADGFIMTFLHAFFITGFLSENKG